MEVRLFYHIAVMGTWRRVVAEQLALFDRVGLTPHIGVVGPLPPDHPLRWGRRVVFESPDLKQYETPTLQKAWEWCRRPDCSPDDVVIYCHTKGVSKPSTLRMLWRHLMHKWTIEPWRDNLRYLVDHDMVGVDYRRAPQRIFLGNFWMARADWLRSLPNPWEHRQPLTGHRLERFTAERWLFCRPRYRYVSLCCEDVWFRKEFVLRQLLQLAVTPPK